MPTFLDVANLIADLWEHWVLKYDSGPFKIEPLKVGERLEAVVSGEPILLPTPEWAARHEALRRRALELWEQVDTAHGGTLTVAEHKIWADVGRKLGAEGGYWIDTDALGQREVDALVGLDTPGGHAADEPEAGGQVLTDADWVPADEIKRLGYATKSHLSKLADPRRHPEIRRLATAGDRHRWPDRQFVHVYDKRRVYELTEGRARE